jgi:hypothetical protein
MNFGPMQQRYLEKLNAYTPRGRALADTMAAEIADARMRRTVEAMLAHNREMNRNRSLAETGRRSDLLYNFDQDQAKNERKQNRRAETLAWAGIGGQGLLSAGQLAGKLKQADKIKKRSLLYR